MDMVGRPLSAVDTAKFPCRIVRTGPPRAKFPLLEDRPYIIRQQLAADGVWQLTVAAKMGQEAR